jgi:hypothetical protein
VKFLGGQSLHSFDPESHSGAHCVALEAAYEVKIQEEASCICTIYFNADDFNVAPRFHPGCQIVVWHLHRPHPPAC